MSVAVESVVGEVCEQFSQEGMRFELIGFDDAAAQLDLRLAFDDVECVDCVMPADYLERMISSSLEKRLERAISVSLTDPRQQDARVDGVRTASTEAPPARKVKVLDPTAVGRSGNPDPGPDAGRLSGKHVLFRVDALWRSWDWAVDEWSSLLEAEGATTSTWKRFQGLPGEEGDRAQADYEANLASADVLISGLANCGSCSAWTIRDALTALNKGVTTMAVATEHFVPLAKLLSEDGGRPGLRLQTLPYPFDIRPEAEVREVARQLFPSVLTKLGVQA